MKPAYLLIAAIAAAGGWLGAILLWHPASDSLKTSAVGARRILLYQSPMPPWVKSDQPGKCTVCGMDLVPIYEGDRSFEQAGGDIVMLPEGSATVAGVQTARVQKQPLVRALRIAGMIGEDESRHGVICAPVEGRIDGLALNHDGQQITRRQPLATMFSRTLLAAALEYRNALAAGGTALEEARLVLERYGLVWEQIKGIPERQADDKYFGILAPLSGTIVKSYIAEGQYVREGDKLFEIADFTKMWFHFAASESELPFLRVGQIVSLHSPTLPGETLKARIAFISPNLDAENRSSKVRVVLENPERRIKNNSYAEGVVEIDSPEVVTIPRSAVLWSGRTPRVYVEKAAGAYQQREVKLGRAGDDCWEVLEGVEAGELIVVAGNILIDGQAQINQ